MDNFNVRNILAGYYNPPLGFFQQLPQPQHLLIRHLQFLVDLYYFDINGTLQVVPHLLILSISLPDGTIPVIIQVNTEQRYKIVLYKSNLDENVNIINHGINDFEALDEIYNITTFTLVHREDVEIPAENAAEIPVGIPVGITAGNMQKKKYHKYKNKYLELNKSLIIK